MGSVFTFVACVVFAILAVVEELLRKALHACVRFFKSHRN